MNEFAGARQEGLADVRLGGAAAGMAADDAVAGSTIEATAAADIWWLARKVAESMSDEEKDVALAAGKDALAKIIYPDDWEYEKIETEEFAQLVYEIIMAQAPACCFIKLDDWRPSRSEYAIFGDVEDVEDLMEIAGAAYERAFTFPLVCEVTAWLTRTRRKRFALDGKEPFGIFFMLVPRWAEDVFEGALDIYVRRMEWKHEGYIREMKGALASLRSAGRDD